MVQQEGLRLVVHQHVRPRSEPCAARIAALPTLAQCPIPLPTQSTMRTLPTFNFCCRSLAVMATELKKQNPLRGWGEKKAGRSASELG
jgi:hypothetical protein